MAQFNFQDRTGYGLLERGQYRFKVEEAECAFSSKGNEMIEMKLAINGVAVTDRLVFTGASAWRIDAFLRATGTAPAKGQDIDITDQFVIGLEGICELGVEKFTKQDGTDGFKNVVTRYIQNQAAPTPAPASQPAAPAPAAKAGDKSEDDLPF
jgi:hypothetical protein